MQERLSFKAEQGQLPEASGGWLQAVGVGWGEKLEDDVDLDPPSMRQAIAWSFALRNIRRAETEEVGERLLRSSGAESVRDVKACPAGLSALSWGDGKPDTDQKDHPAGMPHRPLHFHWETQRLTGGWRTQARGSLVAPLTARHHERHCSPKDQSCCRPHWECPTKCVALRKVQRHP